MGEGRVWFNRIAERAGWLCERCGNTGHSVHHRKKRSQGGPWSWENLVFLCGHGTAGCHGWVEHNANDAEWEGFHVRPWQDPAATQVKYQGEWARLTADGKVTYDGNEHAVQSMQKDTRAKIIRLFNRGARSISPGTNRYIWLDASIYLRND